MAAMTAIEVKSREDFVRFVRQLGPGLEGTDATLANISLPLYLEAIGAWTNDMPGYFANERVPVPEPSWGLFATILEAAITYE